MASKDIRYIYNKKIFQIKYGKIQIKKIENQNEKARLDYVFNKLCALGKKFI